MIFKEVKRVWHNEFGGAFPVECFSRPRIHLPSNGIELALGEARKIGSLGEILSKQSVGVLVDAPLPRAMRVGEVDLHAGVGRELLVLGHLAALVVGHGQTALYIDSLVLTLA
jgi:hypothetical protein